MRRETDVNTCVIVISTRVCGCPSTLRLHLVLKRACRCWLSSPISMRLMSRHEDNYGKETRPFISKMIYLLLDLLYADQSFLCKFVLPSLPDNVVHWKTHLKCTELHVDCFPVCVPLTWKLVSLSVDEQSRILPGGWTKSYCVLYSLSQHSSEIIRNKSLTI